MNSDTNSWHGQAVWGARALPPLVRAVGFAGLLAASAVCDRPSLIVSTHLNFGPLARTLRATLGTPYVLVAHGVDVHPQLSGARMAALRHADGVWAVSRWTRKRLLDIGVSEDRIRVVPNTVSENDFTVAPADSGLRDRYGLRECEKVVLTVARLDQRERYKGYDKVLRALPSVCRAVGPVRYLVVGRGRDAIRLRQLADDLGVADRLTLCGFVPDAELAAHYRMADVFAMPSVGEGFGIVFLEAMACGVPVLGGNRDGTVDALADGELGSLVDPDDGDDVARGLIELLQQRGPATWFDRHALRAACLGRFGRQAFYHHVRLALAPLTDSCPW